MTLHLIRNRPPNCNGRDITLAEFYSICAELEKKPNHVFASWTSRRPRRRDELVTYGSSVYFAEKGKILFRMIIHDIQPVRSLDFPDHVENVEKFENHWSFELWPEIIFVEPRPVRFLRGWRYLEPEDAPPDIDKMPAQFIEDLANVGVIV